MTKRVDETDEAILERADARRANETLALIKEQFTVNGHGEQKLLIPHLKIPRVTQDGRSRLSPASGMKMATAPLSVDHVAHQQQQSAEDLSSSADHHRNPRGSRQKNR